MRCAFYQSSYNIKTKVASSNRKKFTTRMTKLAHIIVFGYILSRQLHQISACKGKSKENGSRRDETITNMKFTYFNTTTISNFFESKFISELWRKEEMQQRVLLSSVYEITFSSCFSPLEQTSLFPSLDVTLYHMNDNNQETVLLNLNSHIRKNNHSLQFSLKSLIPTNRNTLSMTDISSGRKTLNPTIFNENSVSNMTLSILLDFKTYNFFWCFGETNDIDLSYCFLDKRIESISKLSQKLLYGNILLSIENLESHRNNCLLFNKLIVSHNTLVAQKKKSSKNTFQESKFAKQMLHDKALTDNLIYTSDSNLLHHLATVNCNKTKTTCNFKNNPNLFCLNETIICRDYVQNNFEWKSHAQETIIDFNEVDIWSLKYISLNSKMNAGEIHIIGENGEILEAIMARAIINETTDSQAHHLSSKSFDTIMYLNTERNLDRSILFMLEFSYNATNICSEEPNVNLYIAPQESRVVDRIEYFGKIKSNSRHWKLLRIIGFNLDLEIKVETLKPKTNDSSLTYTMDCSANIDISFIPIVVGSISIVLVILVLVIIVGYKIYIKNTCSQKKISRNKNNLDEVDIGKNTIQNEYDIPMIEKSMENDYDDAIDVDAIEESAYTTNLANQDMNTISKRDDCSSDRMDDDNTSIFQDDNGEKFYVMKDFREIQFR